MGCNWTMEPWGICFNFQLEISFEPIHLLLGINGLILLVVLIGILCNFLLQWQSKNLDSTATTTENIDAGLQENFEPIARPEKIDTDFEEFFDHSVTMQFIDPDLDEYTKPTVNPESEESTLKNERFKFLLL